MYISVQANDFCPNDCPYCEVEHNVLYKDTPPFVEHKCRYADICEYAVKHYKWSVGKKMQDGFNDGCNGMKAGQKND